MFCDIASVAPPTMDCKKGEASKSCHFEGALLGWLMVLFLIFSGGFGGLFAGLEFVHG
jgi:hypothetical protein